jgi:hypothetical protein
MAMRRKSLRRLRTEALAREAQAPPEVRKTFRKVNRKRRNRHHLIPKCRGGGYNKRNLLYISVTTHCDWHKVFKNLTLDEVIELLIRVRRAKQQETQ